MSLEMSREMSPETPLKTPLDTRTKTHGPKLVMALAAALVGGLLLAASWWLVLMFAPTEAIMGPIQKIFYIHLPLSWWALFSFFLLFLTSILTLALRNDRWDALSQALAEVGVLFTTLTLVTGMLWGRKAWGVWWTWDPRLTTALVLWFIYMGYLLVSALDMAPARRRTVRAVLGIVAFADVPLVFLSARLWRSIHPAVFANESGGLDPDMKLTAIFSVVAMGVFWLGLVLLRSTLVNAQGRVDALVEREQERDDGFQVDQWP